MQLKQQTNNPIKKEIILYYIYYTLSKVIFKKQNFAIHQKLQSFLVR